MSLDSNLFLLILLQSDITNLIVSYIVTLRESTVFSSKWEIHGVWDPCPSLRRPGGAVVLSSLLMTGCDQICISWSWVAVLVVTRRVAWVWCGICQEPGGGLTGLILWTQQCPFILSDLLRRFSFSLPSQENWRTQS